jgi:SRSO17 transposase
VPGLLAGLPRTNCRAIAGQAGDPSPDGMQHLLARARRDAGGVRDDVRGYVTGHLGDPGAARPATSRTAPPRRAGSVRTPAPPGGPRNAQVAVYLGDAAPRGHALIDRELYLPRSWTGDRDRCAAAGIPATVTSATRPQLARPMTERAAGAAVPFAWVAGDGAYGGNGPLRTWLETRRIACVLAVACDHRVPAGAGRTLRAGQLAARLPGKARQRLPAGAAAKGHRRHDRAWVTGSDPRPGHRHLLIRRNRRTGDLASCRCYSPQQVTLAALVTAAGPAGPSRRTPRPAKA